jgi:2,3-diketo-5-methylthio-1-phosphopentane phosphatase
MNNLEKQLIIFDFDNTIVDGFSDFPAIELIENKVKKDQILGKYIQGSWIEVMQEIFNELSLQNVGIDVIKEAVENVKLTEGFNELIEFVNTKSNLFESIIISGGNSIFIEWLIKKHKHKFQTYYALPAIIENQSIIKVEKHHIHTCKICPIEQCKQKVIEDHIKNRQDTKYQNFFFVGDGYNDYCPAVWLGPKDYIFPRENYILQKLINDNRNKIRCNISPWKTGHDILKILKKFI